MKNILIAGALSMFIVACSDSKTENAEAARQSAIDSMQNISNLQVIRQRTIDSMNLINSQNPVIINPIETSSIAVQGNPGPVKTHHHAAGVTPATPQAQTPVSTNNGTVVNSGAVATSGTATSTVATEEEKKKTER